MVNSISRIPIGLLLLGGASISCICYYLYTKLYQKKQTKNTPGIGTLAQTFVPNYSQGKRYDMNIPFYALDMLVGSKERNLKSIERESEASIKLQKYDREDFVRKSSMLRKNLCLTISGAPAAVSYASSRIKEKLSEISIVEIEVPVSKVRLLIGKNGSNIKRVRDASGAQILVSQEDEPPSTSAYSSDLLVNSNRTAPSLKLVYIYGYANQTKIAQESIANLLNTGTIDKFQSLLNSKRSKIDVSSSSSQNAQPLESSNNQLCPPIIEKITFTHVLSLFHSCPMKLEQLTDKPRTKMQLLSGTSEFSLFWFFLESHKEDRKDFLDLLASYYVLGKSDFEPKPAFLQHPGELCVVHMECGMHGYENRLLERALLLCSLDKTEQHVLLLLETGHIVCVSKENCFKLQDDLLEYPLYAYPCILECDSSNPVRDIPLKTQNSGQIPSYLISKSPISFVSGYAHLHSLENCEPEGKLEFNCEIISSEFNSESHVVKIGIIEPVQQNPSANNKLLPAPVSIGTEDNTDLLCMRIDSPVEPESENSILSPEHFFSAQECSCEIDQKEDIADLNMGDGFLATKNSKPSESKLASSESKKNEEINKAFLVHLKNTFEISDKPSNPTGLPKTPMNSVSTNLSVNDSDHAGTSSSVIYPLVINESISSESAFESPTSYIEQFDVTKSSFTQKATSHLPRNSNDDIFHVGDLENLDAPSKTEENVSPTLGDVSYSSKSQERSAKAKKRRNSAKKSQ